MPVAPKSRMFMARLRAAVRRPRRSRARAPARRAGSRPRAPRPAPAAARRAGAPASRHAAAAGPRKRVPAVAGDQQRRKGLDVEVVGDVGVVLDVDPGEAELRMRARHLLEQRPVLAAGAAPFGAQADDPQRVVGAAAGLRERWSRSRPDADEVGTGPRAIIGTAADPAAAACAKGPCCHRLSSGGACGISSSFSSGSSGVLAGSASST